MGAPEAIGAGSVLQVLLGLVLVLGLVAGAAWVMKRLGGHSLAATGALRVVAGTAVGQRERVVVVEIDSTWMVVGVAPGQVRTLHVMPRPEGGLAVPAAPAASFPAWLKRAREKRDAG